MVVVLSCGISVVALHLQNQKLPCVVVLVYWGGESVLLVVLCFPGLWYCFCCSKVKKSKDFGCGGGGCVFFCVFLQINIPPLLH